MVRGVVTYFNDAKGFGRITDEFGDEYFVVREDVKGGSLQEGDNVIFQSVRGGDGLEAKEVIVVGEFEELEEDEELEEAKEGEVEELYEEKEEDEELLDEADMEEEHLEEVDEKREYEDEEEF